MSVAQEITSQYRNGTARRRRRRNGRWSGYPHLLMARLLELKREPEVVFWVFVFPLLLALGSGHCFPQQTCGCGVLAIVAGTGSQDAQALLPVPRNTNYSRFRSCQRTQRKKHFALASSIW